MLGQDVIFAKKSLGKKQCKMDIGRENNAAPAKKPLKRTG